MYTYHIENWIAECERLKLTIRAKGALEAIAAFQGTQLEPQVQQRPQFTPEHFMDALAEFIIATDQVYFNFILFFAFLPIIYSLSVLWTLRSLETFCFCFKETLKTVISLIAQ